MDRTFLLFLDSHRIRKRLERQKIVFTLKEDNTKAIIAQGKFIVIGGHMFFPYFNTFTNQSFCFFKLIKIGKYYSHLTQHIGNLRFPIQFLIEYQTMCVDIQGSYKVERLIVKSSLFKKQFSEDFWFTYAEFVDHVLYAQCCIHEFVHSFQAKRPLHFCFNDDDPDSFFEQHIEIFFIVLQQVVSLFEDLMVLCLQSFIVDMRAFALGFEFKQQFHHLGDLDCYLDKLLFPGFSNVLLLSLVAYFDLLSLFFVIVNAFFYVGLCLRGLYALNLGSLSLGAVEALGRG